MHSLSSSGNAREGDLSSSNLEESSTSVYYHAIIIVFMVFIMGILNATSIVKNVIIAAAVVGSIQVVFQMIFRVPLP